MWVINNWKKESGLICWEYHDENSRCKATAYPVESSSPYILSRPDLEKDGLMLFRAFESNNGERSDIVFLVDSKGTMIKVIFPEDDNWFPGGSGSFDEHYVAALDLQKQLNKLN